MTEANHRELAQLEQRDHIPKRSDPELALVVAEVVARRDDGAITQTRALRDATDEDLEARGWVRKEASVDTTPEEKALALMALERARPKQAAVVSLYLEGLTQEAIAARLGVSQQRVSQALSQGSKNLGKLQSRLASRRASRLNNS